MGKLLLFCIALSAMAFQSAVAQITANDVRQAESKCAKGEWIAQAADKAILAQ